MERLTVRPPESDEAYLSCEKCGKKAISECWDEMDCQQTALERLASIEDILGNEYDLDRLRELVEAEKMLGEDVHFPKDKVSGEVKEICINKQCIWCRIVDRRGGSFYLQFSDVKEFELKGEQDG